MKLSSTESEASCKLRQCGKAEVSLIKDMLDGVLSKHESADLKIEIRDLKAQVKELEKDHDYLASELEKEQSRNQEADLEGQHKEQKFLKREHDDAKGVYE